MTGLRRELHGGVLTLTLDRPEQLNALDAATADEVVAALREARVPEVRAVVVTGRGRAFCAGADLRRDLPVPGLLADASVRVEDDGRPTTAGAVPMLDRANALALALADAQVPVVAVVNGVAAGLGTSLALGSDLLVMAESARLVLGFSKIGLVPDGGATFALRRRVGPAVASGMALLEDALDAPTALRLGVATRVFADDELAERVADLLRHLVSGNAAAQRRLTALLRDPDRPALQQALLAESRAQLSLIRDAAVAATTVDDTTNPTASVGQKAGSHA